MNVRRLTDADAQSLIELVRDVSRDCDTIVLTAEEFQPTLDQEQAFLRMYEARKGSIALGAIEAGHLIGNLLLERYPQNRRGHCGSFGMSVHPAHQGKGVGTALLQEMMTLSSAEGILERIELVVLSNNLHGQSLYARFGFVEEGRRRNAVRLRDQYLDEILMAVELQSWRKRGGPCY